LREEGVKGYPRRPLTVKNPSGAGRVGDETGGPVLRPPVLAATAEGTGRCDRSVVPAGRVVAALPEDFA